MQHPAQSPKHALLNAHASGCQALSASVVMGFFSLLKALKWTEHHHSGTVTHTHSSRYFIFTHTSQNKCGTATAHNHLTAESAPPRLGLPFKCLSPHFLRMRSRHACACGSPPRPSVSERHAFRRSGGGKKASSDSDWRQAG